MIERWGLRLAKWLDRHRQLADVPESLGAALRLFGVTRFRDRQLDVVLAALRGESVLFVSPTGSGKTLCFQVPVVLRDGFGLVISPLKALMNSQVGSLTAKKVPATFINGDLGPREKKIRYQLLRDHAVKFLYCTPERFDPTMVRPAEVGEIAQTRPQYLIVDEAHCIDRWGGDFRPNYGRLGAIRRTLGSPPVLAFTATAGMPTQRRILESLEITDARVVVTSVDRPNIALARLPVVEDDDRFRLMAELLRVLPNGRAMIFVPTVRVGQQVQSGLRSLELDLPFYHSRLGTANDRDMLLGQFTGRLSPPVKVVICTTAFGTGLDLPDVRLVVHWQHPASVEDYLQEFGRGGRDGKPSVALLFTRSQDSGLLRFMAEKTVDSAGLDDETRSGVLEAKYEAIEQMAQRASNLGACFRATIIEYFEGPRSAKRRFLATRIVEWIFSRSEHIAKPRCCCDRCDRVGIANVESWVDHVLRPSR
jgi:RecQ family ATP-dependent DNA helicase